MAARDIETVLSEMAAAKTQIDNLGIEAERIERASERTFADMTVKLQVADQMVSLAVPTGQIRMTFRQARSFAGWCARRIGTNGPVKDEEPTGGA